MKTFLRFISALLFVCVTCSAFAQAPLQWSTPGTYQWVCPGGVTGVTVQLWGAGGGSNNSYNYAGGGGAYTQSTVIPVTPGTTYQIVVGDGKTNVNSDWSLSNSTFGVAGNAYVLANGGRNNGDGGAASSGGYVATSYVGGKGPWCWNAGTYANSGGGASASSCGKGEDGHWNGDNGIGKCGGGFGGYGGSNGNFPGGGAGGGNNSNYYGGDGTVILTPVATTINYDNAGTYNWVCPPGVSYVSLQLWGAGAGPSPSINLWASGGGGAFTQSGNIPVTPGQTYQILVAKPAGYNVQGYSSFSNANGILVYANSATTPSRNIYQEVWPGGQASSGQYTNYSYSGGNGYSSCRDNGCSGENPQGGGAAAGPCGPGATPGFLSSAGATGYCGSGSGGDWKQNGVFPGGGAGGTDGTNSSPVGAGGRVILSYTCDAGTPGTIGNGHSVTYPQERVPDSVTNILSPTAVSGLTITWQQSTDNVNFVTAKKSTNTPGYRFDNDSLQITTYYRRGNNTCVAGFGNWSNTVQIKVLTSTNGRNGGITGLVQTRNGTAIANRKVYAKSLTPLKGRPVGFLDSAFTDQQGKFSIDTVFYGDKNYGDSATVRFKVYADTAGGHLYSPASAEINLSTLHPAYDLGSQPFRDTSSFAVTGQVYQICTGCLDKNDVATTITGPLDSVHVYGTGKNHSLSTNEKDSTITGYRTPPGTYGNYGLIFQYEDQYTINAKFKNHKFKPVDTLLTVNNNVSNVNFNDTTTHVISGFVGAGCNDFIGKAVIEFYDSLPPGIDGKARTSVFRKQITTFTNGKYSIRLPARAYKVKLISITVNDPIDPSTTATVVKSYFKALPVDSVYRDISTSDAVLNLLYQRAPQISVSGLNGDSARVITCSAFKNYDFWPQGVTRPVTFKVYQGPVSRGCLLKTGQVYVSTDISNTLGHFNYDTVQLNQGIGVDSIVAAQPNTVINPVTNTYSKSFHATFKDIINRSVSTDTAKPALPIVVVTGAALDPSGTDFVTVSPQIPFLVLHDPPGNASSATWAQSVTNSQAISFKAQKQESEGGFVNVKLGLSQIIGLFVEIPVEVWAKVDTKFSTTKTTTNTTESIITNTAEQVIETIDNSAYVASDADLIYGAALNINYRIGTEIEWDSTHCLVVPPKPVMVTDIKNDTTSFLYTQGYIKYQEIPRLQQAAAAQTRADSIAYFNNQVKVWQQLIDNNEANVKAAPVLQNISFSNGTSQTFSNTLENSSTNTYDFDLEINTDLAVAVGFEFAGTGVEGGYNVGFKMTTGSSTTSTNTTSTTTSYTLADDNAGGPTYEGDYISVNVKKDPVYGTPMFETVAGGTQCPHEVGTIALDHPVITANVQTLKGVTKDTANFTLLLNNLSLDATPNGKRPYILFLNAASNPGGATVLIGGTSSPDGVTYQIPNNGGVQPVTVSVIRNSAGGVYNYDNLEFILSDPCFPPLVQGFFSNPHEYSSLNISADFASPVSGVTLVSPVNNWVANKASNDSVKITFNGYDTSKLSSIAVQYNIPGTGNWVTLTTYQKTRLGKTSTNYYWKIAQIADGPYNIRLQVKDKSANIIYSRVSAGIIDRKPPVLFGTPQPASAVYTTGTQISYSYTENINTASIRNTMVTMRDLTTNTPILFDISAFTNTMIIVPKVDMSLYTGHLFRVIADSVSDLYGNTKLTNDTLYFTVASANYGTGTDALNITSGKTSIYEDSKGSVDIHFTRSSPVSVPTVVYYNILGDAVYNQNYTVTYNAGQTTITGISNGEGTIILPKDSSAVTMYIRPINDTILKPNKTFSITLSPGGNYNVGSRYRITDTILDHNITPPVITASKNTTLCSGDSLTLSTSTQINGKPVTLLWSTNSTASSIKVKTSGSYTVKATDATGFTGYSAPTVVTFTCGSPVPLAPKVISKSSAVLTWNVINCAKKYTVHYRKVGNLTWITDTVNSNLDTLKGLLANTSYEWQVASICQYPVIIISAYTAGTNFKTPVSFAQNAVTNTVTFKEAAAGDGFSASVYPNPASASAHLKVLGAKGTYTILLQNLAGAVLWKAEKITDNDVQLPLTNFSAGIYMITVYDEGHKARLKLVRL